MMCDGLVRDQADLREPREQRFDGDACYQERKRASGADVGTVAKSKMGRRIGTLDIKLVGMRKLARITVGRSEQHQQSRSGRNTASGKLDLLGCLAKLPLHRRLNSESFM